MFKEAFAKARSNLDQFFYGQLVQRSLCPGLTTALGMSYRDSANYLCLIYNCPYKLNYCGTRIAMDCFVSSWDLANGASSLGSTMFGSLEWWRCLIPPSFSLQNLQLS